MRYTIAKLLITNCCTRFDLPATSSGSGVRPVYFIGLPNFHAGVAVLPVVGSSEFLVVGIVMLALETLACFS